MNTTEHITNKGQGITRIPNKLAEEKSPYLLQHAYNPVKWYPWGEEAFKKAKSENKPIFLSIGYSTCHWCHVMAHESFEDQEVADFINRYFVAIKVDKEERPDIDSIYMSVCQRLTGSGGWPLTIFMLPDQKPFFAGTYYPKRSRYSMPGILDLLEAVQEKWTTDRQSLIHTGEGITNALKEEAEPEVKEDNLSEELVVDALRSLMDNFDRRYGGFGRAPKFPTPHNLMFLLRAAYYKKEDKALNIVEKTLESMYKGGIFDHIGYGFSRYSTDAKWLVPHFEKMLYDNGLLILTYLEAYQFTKKEQYKQIAQMTMEYVLRELTSEDGGFYCAQDADSEGVEGKYYIFTMEEITGLLGKEDGEYFNQYYGITSKGNFEGKNIPNRLHTGIFEENPVLNQKKKTGILNKGIRTSSEIINKEKTGTYCSLENERIMQLRKKVFDYRESRTTLHKDDKILTSWNGIMIAAFARAYKILGKEEYLLTARRAEQFIDRYLQQEDNLYVHYRDGEARGTGHIDDYAFYSLALIELYESVFDIRYLERALSITKMMINKFFDRDRGGFYLYSKDGERLINRPKEIYDGAVPSGNSAAAYVLLKLAAYTGNTELAEAAEKQISYIAANIAGYPSAHCFSLMAVTMIMYPSRELIIVLPDSSFLPGVREFSARHYLPDITILVKMKENEERLAEFAEFTKNYRVDENAPVYYLCENHACRAPVYDIKELENLLIKTEELV